MTSRYNLWTLTAIGAAGALAAGLLVDLVLAVGPARAAFPGDNGKIAFTSNRDGNPDIYVMDSDGQNPTRLTNNAALDVLPDWGVAASGQAPEANDDSYSTNEDAALNVPAPGVLGNDTDPENNPLTATKVTDPSDGTLTLNSNGSFTYTPDANFSGTDSFKYKANDGTNDSNEATVTITVNPINNAPSVRVARGGACLSDRSGTINLTVDDLDNPVGSLTLSGTSSNTSLVRNANITFGGSGAERTLRATAVSGRSGTAILSVTASDGNKSSPTLSISVSVGTNANNTLTGTSGTDMIFGRGGRDTIEAGAANDLTCGGAGNDVLRGQSEDDTMGGDNGNDTLTGGLGADHFSGGIGTDTATDFNAGQGDTTDGT